MRIQLYNTDENPIRAKFIKKRVKENSWRHKNKYDYIMFCSFHIDIAMDCLLDGYKKR